MSLKYPKWQFNFWSPNHKNTNIHNFKDNVSSQYLIQIKRYIGVGQVASPNSVYSGGGGGGGDGEGGGTGKKDRVCYNPWVPFLGGVLTAAVNHGQFRFPGKRIDFLLLFGCYYYYFPATP